MRCSGDTQICAFYAHAYPSLVYLCIFYADLPGGRSLKLNIYAPESSTGKIAAFCRCLLKLRRAIPGGQSQQPGRLSMHVDAGIHLEDAGKQWPLLRGHYRVNDRSVYARQVT